MFVVISPCLPYAGVPVHSCSVAQLLSCVRLFERLWTVACQVPLSMGFPKQEYWSGLPFPSPGNLPNPGIKPTSLGSPALAGGVFTTEPPGKPLTSGSVQFSSVASDSLRPPWTVAYEAPQSMGFSSQEYWSGLPFPSPGDLPDPGVEPRSPALQADALPSQPPSKEGKLEIKKKTENK